MLDRISLRAIGAVGRGLRPQAAPTFTGTSSEETKGQITRYSAGDIEAGARFAQKRSVPRYPFAALALIDEPLTGTEIAVISGLNRKIGLDQSCCLPGSSLSADPGDLLSR